MIVDCDCPFAGEFFGFCFGWLGCSFVGCFVYWFAYVWVCGLDFLCLVWVMMVDFGELAFVVFMIVGLVICFFRVDGLLIKFG